MSCHLLFIQLFSSIAASVSIKLLFYWHMFAVFVQFSRVCRFCFRFIVCVRSFTSKFLTPREMTTEWWLLEKKKLSYRLETASAMHLFITFYRRRDLHQRPTHTSNKSADLLCTHRITKLRLCQNACHSSTRVDARPRCRLRSSKVYWFWH